MKTPVKELLTSRLAIIALALAAIVGICAFSFSGVQDNAWADDEEVIDTWADLNTTRNSDNGKMRLDISWPGEGEATCKATITNLTGEPIPASTLYLNTVKGIEMTASFGDEIGAGGTATAEIEGSVATTGFRSARLVKAADPEPATVTVTFNLNGFGAFPEGTALNEDGTATITAVDGAVTSPVPTDPDNDFGGWFTDESLTTPFDGTAATSMTVFAKWTPKEAETITVTFDLNGHGKFSNDTNVEADGTVKLVAKNGKVSLPVPPTDDEYDFNGWADSDGNEFTGSATESMVVYAQWEEKGSSDNEDNKDGDNKNNGTDTNGNKDSNDSGATKPTETTPTDFTIVISKTDAKTGKALSGAEFTLADKAGNVIDSWTSDGTGKTYTLDRGTSYVLTETKAPTGYNREKAININFSTDDGKASVKIDQGGRAVALPINNDGNAALNVKDLSGTALQGTSTTAPKTGDNQNMPLASLCFGAAALVAGGIAATAYRKRQAL